MSHAEAKEQIMRIRSIRDIAERHADRVNGASTPSLAIPKTTLSEAEAAQYIGMSAAWLKKSRTKRFRGIIDAPPFVRAGAKRVVYRVEDLDAWQERHLEHVGPARESDAANPTAADVAADPAEATA